MVPSPLSSSLNSGPAPGTEFTEPTTQNGGPCCAGRSNRSGPAGSGGPGTIDKGREIGRLVAIALRVVETRDLAERLEAMERTIERRRAA
jgi:hypothetical protein